MEREIAYCAQTTFTDAEIAELISEVDDLDARLDLLQGAKLPEDLALKLELVAALCRLSSTGTIIAGNIAVGIDGSKLIAASQDPR
jgi:3-hydroxyacyl-CoA dehydrogenase